MTAMTGLGITTVVIDCRDPHRLARFWADALGYQPSEGPEDWADLRSEAEASLLLAHHGANDFRIQNIAQEILKIRKEIKVVLRNWHIVLGTIASTSAEVFQSHNWRT